MYKGIDSPKREAIKTFKDIYITGLTFTAALTAGTAVIRIVQVAGNSKVAMVGEEVATWLGAGAKVTKDDGKSFRIVSADGKRAMRIDMGHQGGKDPHVHFEIDSSGKMIDAIPGKHQIPFLPN